MSLFFHPITLDNRRGMRYNYMKYFPRRKDR